VCPLLCRLQSHRSSHRLCRARSLLLLPHTLLSRVGRQPVG
jgi:hypothetical protein